MRPTVLATGALYALMPDESAALTTYAVFGPTKTYVTTQSLLPTTHAMPTATFARPGNITLSLNTTLIPAAVRNASSVSSSMTSIPTAAPTFKPVAPKGQRICNEVCVKSNSC